MTLTRPVEAEDRIGQSANCHLLSAPINKLAAYRKGLGMRQSYLAKEAGLTPSISRIEKGERQPPQLEHLIPAIQTLRLTTTQAVELVHLAGYSPTILIELPLDPTGRTKPPQVK